MMHFNHDRDNEKPREMLAEEGLDVQLQFAYDGQEIPLEL
jgi:hypothetical protein